MWCVCGECVGRVCVARSAAIAANWYHHVHALYICCTHAACRNEFNYEFNYCVV